MKLFSVAWKASRKPAKQRKYRSNSPYHHRRRFLIAPLSKELKAGLSIKRFEIRAGDTVRLVRGEMKGVVGKVNSVNARLGVVYVDGVERIRRDGTKAYFPLYPSNLMVTEIDMEDKRRAASLADRRKAAAGKK